MAEALAKPPLKALGTPKGFRIGIYLEHLEEASFLHAQLSGFRKDPAWCWRDSIPFEDRLEAHLDGLLVGGDLAAEVCQQRLAEGDAGEIHAALRVFARADYRGESFTAWKALDWNDPEVAAAAADALSADLPHPWRPDLEARLAGFPPPLQLALLRAAGHRRIPFGMESLKLLRRSEAVTFADFARYLGRCGDPALKDYLYHRLVRDPGSENRGDCALASARLGDRRILGLLKERSREGWTWMPLALVHGPECRDALSAAARGDSGGDAWLALGLHGAAAGVEPLLEALSGSAAREAAWSLHLITGAGLWEAGEPESEEAEPPALPTRDKARWRAWWTANRSRFQPTLRYRLGRPASPEALLEALLAPDSLGPFRPWLLEELAVVYGLDPRIESDDESSSQLKALEKLRHSLHGRAGAFTAGRWHFAGVQT